MTASLPPPPAMARPVRRPTVWWARLASVVLIVAVPMATWWLVGPNPGNEIGSDPTLRPDDYDYLFHPPTIDAGVERFGGIAAVVAVVVSVGAFLTALSRATETFLFISENWPSTTLVSSSWVWVAISYTLRE